MEETLPVINLELSSGVFRIRTNEAIYQITVNLDNPVARVVEKVVEKEVDRAPDSPVIMAAAVEADDLFYREMSEELYSEIGKLARQLSLSIKEIPGKGFAGVNIEQTGQELEDAKGQLEDIVQMTEKASMDIMDLAESIQDDLSTVTGQIQTIKGLDFIAGQATELDWDDVPDEPEGEATAESDPLAAGPNLFADFIAILLDQENKLRTAVTQLPVISDTPKPVQPAAPAAPAAPVMEKVTTYIFDIDVIFQTLYELCTNEAVKDHIKIMRAEQQTGFNSEAVLKFLADLAPTVDVEDNFFNFPLATILKGLFQTTDNEKFKQILKKMNQTAGSIFLDTILPILGEIEEKEIEVQGEVAGEAEQVEAAPISAQPGIPPEQIEELAALIDENISRITAEKERLESTVQEAQPEASKGPAADGTHLKDDDREKIAQALDTANGAVQQIMPRITSILEALSFQDLSGQRIYKIVQLISAVQVQLLSLLVSFGAKIKKRQELPETLAADSKAVEKVAQDEVDKMLERVSTQPSEMEGPDAEGSLDQDAVNDMLADLGF